MESPENDSAVFRPSHKPWKSIKPIPTFPAPPRRRTIYERIPKRSRPCCPPQTDPSGSFLDWKRLETGAVARRRFGPAGCLDVRPGERSALRMELRPRSEEHTSE